MAHIELNNDQPGIRGPMTYSPETARPMNELAEILLRSENNSLTKGERELIGTYVSYLNDCFFCQSVHGAMAGHYMACDIEQIEAFKRDYEHSDLSDKMKSLLAIAGAVQKGGKHVTKAQVERAKLNGATDKEIHDTVLIAAAFCMFNRYVDGLGTDAPRDTAFYVNRAPVRAEIGYVDSIAVR
jgi:uncharacterized peroxidase-related enzyme